MPQRKVKKNKPKQNQLAVRGSGAYQLPPNVTRGLQYAAETSFPNPKKKNTWQNQLAQTLGGFAGGAFGGPVGSALGSSAGGALARWLGYGKYSVSRNSLTKMRPGNVPEMHQMNESIVLRHREYITDVITGTSNGFNVNSYNLNPGVDTTFPWGSSVAQAYQEWKPKGIIFEFVSTSADALNSTNTALGSVIMATQYRASAPAFTSKSQMENEFFASSGKPSENQCHPIECAPKEDPYNIHYVRGNAVPTGDDVKLYDIGLFSLATTGFQASNVNIGELWVSYEIELLKPATAEYSGQFLPSAHYNLTVPSNSNYFGGATLEWDSIGFTVSGNVITAPKELTPGTYMLIYQNVGTSAAMQAPSIAYTQGLAVVNLWDVSALDSTSAVSTGSSTGGQFILCLTFTYVPNNNATLPTMTFSSGTIPTASSNGDLFIFQLNSNLVK